MSFDIRPIKQPIIQNTQKMKNDGGGGNLGYMSQGQKQKEEKEENNQKKDLLNNEEIDVIEITEEDFPENKVKEEDFSPKKWLGDVVNKISKKLIKKSNNPFKNMPT